VKDKVIHWLVMVIIANDLVTYAANHMSLVAAGSFSVPHKHTLRWQ